MADQQTKAARPVKAFLGRLGVQIVVSGSAMAAIHTGLRVMPDLGNLLGSEAQLVASVEAPLVLKPVVFVPQASDKSDRLPPLAAGFPAAAPAIAAPPLPGPAPARPVQTASLEKPKAKGVQRFDTCDPACPSRDPLLRPQPAAMPSLIPVADRGTEFPEHLHDDPDDGSSSLFSIPGHALGAAGRTTRNVWNRVESLLPF